MIAIVVGLGATIFAFSTTSFTDFGNNFVSMISNSGNQVLEQYIVEQITFSTSGSQGANLYVRNYGQNPVTIASVYVVNVTANSPVQSYQLSPQVTIQPGSFSIISLAYTPKHGFTYGFTLASTLGSTVVAYGKTN
jgi:hypothetical protein